MDDTGHVGSQIGRREGKGEEELKFLDDKIN